MSKITSIFTSSRADYYLIKPLADRLEKNINVDLNVLISGAHLQSVPNEIVSSIEANHAKVKKIPLIDYKTTFSSIQANFSHLTKHYFQYFEQNKIDLLFLLGDRYETFIAAYCAFFSRIPIAHIHGGEVTYGALDDSLRHSISKFSQIHFVADNEFRKRLINMGENPESIFEVGPMAADNILDTDLFSREEICALLNIPINKEYALVCIHPETVDIDQNLINLKKLLNVAAQNSDTFFIFTSSNLDEGGEDFTSKIKDFCDRSNNSFYFDNLGGVQFLSTISHAYFMIGNSSSGIIEAPLLGTPSISLGNRQKGRLLKQNSDIIKFSEFKEEDIEYSISWGKEFSSRGAKFQKLDTSIISPSKQIESILSELNFNISFSKRFYDA